MGQIRTGAHAVKPVGSTVKTAKTCLCKYYRAAGRESRGVACLRNLKLWGAGRHVSTAQIGTADGPEELVAPKGYDM